MYLGKTYSETEIMYNTLTPAQWKYTQKAAKYWKK